MSEPVQYQPTGTTASEIAASFESAIERGTLVAGDRMPSVRALAATLEVSPSTVASALRELRRRGLIVSHERSGSRVSERPPVAGPRGSAQVPPGVQDLASGNPDPTLLPDLNAALKRVELPQRLYGAAPAVDELLAMAGRAFAADGISARHLCVVSGALDGVERVLGANLRQGDRIALADPGYTGLVDLVRALGLVPRPVAIDEHGLLPDALARVLAGGAEAVLLSPRGHNPTGAALDSDRASALSSVLERRPQALVIEDDHLGAVSGSRAHTVTGDRERWAVIRSVGKTLGPDLRVAALAGDPRTVSRVEGRLLVGPGWVSHLLQRVVVELWSDAATRALLDRATSIYADRRMALLAALAEREIAAVGSSGSNVWVPVAEESPIVDSLLQAGIAVRAGTPFRIESPPAVRVTTAALPVGRAEPVADAVSRALRPAQRTRAA